MRDATHRPVCRPSGPVKPDMETSFHGLGYARSPFFWCQVAQTRSTLQWCSQKTGSSAAVRVLPI